VSKDVNDDGIREEPDSEPSVPDDRDVLMFGIWSMKPVAELGEKVRFNGV
jgi:hypothetical protein